MNKLLFATATSHTLTIRIFIYSFWWLDESETFLERGLIVRRNQCSALRIAGTSEWWLYMWELYSYPYRALWRRIDKKPKKWASALKTKDKTNIAEKRRRGIIKKPRNSKTALIKHLSMFTFYKFNKFPTNVYDVSAEHFDYSMKSGKIEWLDTVYSIYNSS